MSQTSKPFSDFDHQQILQKAYNPTDGSLLTGTFIAAQNGNRVDVAYPTSTTETYSYSEGSTLLYVITVTYTDSTKANVSSVARTA